MQEAERQAKELRGREEGRGAYSKTWVPRGRKSGRLETETEINGPRIWLRGHLQGRGYKVH